VPTLSGVLSVTHARSRPSCVMGYGQADEAVNLNKVLLLFTLIAGSIPILLLLLLLLLFM